MPWPVRMTLVLSAVLLLGHIYVWRRLGSAAVTLLGTPARPARWAAWGVTVFLNLLPLVLLIGYKAGFGERLFASGLQRHWLDYALTFPFWWGVLVVVELLPYFLATDLLGGALRLAGITPGSPGGAGLAAVPWFRILAGIKVAVAVFFFVFVAAVAYRDTNRVRLHETAVAVPALPAELSGMRLVLLGDVQVDRDTGDGKLTQVRERLRQANGDLIFFAGDLVTDGEEFVEPGLRALCGLSAPLGRLACMGDHDWWSAPDRISRGLAGCGWEFLENRHQVIETGRRPPATNYRPPPDERRPTTDDRPDDGRPTADDRRPAGESERRRILVTGVRYIYSDRPSGEELDALLASAPPADVKILLVHQPAEAVVAAAARHGYHLLLAGHTHGGQMVFHPFGVELTPTQKENRYYSGHYVHGKMHVVVTNGVGLTLAPLRYGAPAEVSLVILQ